MLIERPLNFFRKFFKGTVWIRPKKEKTIYLTFDDGPNPEVTPLVLAILEKNKINATFFCVGENVTKYPQLYESVLDKGHKVGNHTYNHLKGFEVSLETYIDNVKKAAEVIDSKLFRPPYGRITFKQLQALKPDFEIIMWDLITRDYNPEVSPKQILRFVEKLARNGSIIVFHDSLKSKHNVLTALPLVINTLQKKGYHFDTL
jgi:peptidoglycan/xylan/chitin deacetylase (PgdA/CDA1 family)